MFVAGSWDKRQHLDWNLCLQIKRTNHSSQWCLPARYRMRTRLHFGSIQKHFTDCRIFLFCNSCWFFFLLDMSSIEKEKKLTFDLKNELSGDFCKAMLLLAEVCHSYVNKKLSAACSNTDQCTWTHRYMCTTKSPKYIIYIGNWICLTEWLH